MRYLPFVSVAVLFVSLAVACSDGTETAEKCVTSELVKYCPPGSAPELNANAFSNCEAEGDLNVVKEAGSVAGSCKTEGTCEFICRFQEPCACGVDSITSQGVFCNECTVTACGDGECDPGETPESCAVDCGERCTADKERCSGEDRQVCSQTGVWETLPCQVGYVCQEDGDGTTSCAPCGECIPADVETQDCGLCGTQTRTCAETCQWMSWTTCQQPVCCTDEDCGEHMLCNNGSCEPCGICIPGDVETEECGTNDPPCGTMTRTCSNTCQWMSYSACDEPDCCGDTDCGEGFYCQEGICIEGTCKPNCEGIECGPDPDCGIICGVCETMGEVCTDTGSCCMTTCEDKECGDNGCGGVCGTCDDEHPLCVAGQCLECAQDAQCLEGWACEQGACIECTTEAPCPDGLYCNAGVCGITECVADGDCAVLDPVTPTNWTCSMGMCRQCKTDDDCPGGLVCLQGVCGAEACASDEDCTLTDGFPSCTSGACVQCGSTDDCFGGLGCIKGVCGATTCAVDGDCPLASPFCDDGVCAECKVPGAVCVGDSGYCHLHACVSCLEDFHCQDFGGLGEPQCQDPVCDKDEHTCSAIAANEGEACEDAFFCTTGETCQGGLCTGGTATDCSSAVTDATCQEGVCDESSTSCIAEPANEGQACEDDGLTCTTDQCEEGTCAHTPIAGRCLIDGACYNQLESEADNQCHYCDSTTFPNSWSTYDNGTPCDDGSFCTVDDQCQGGVCQGTARDCSSSLSEPQCQQVACDDDIDACVVTPINEGGACDDTLWCTVGDSCQAGVCASTARDCSGVITEAQCQAPSCDEETDQCVGTSVHEDDPCEDGLFCTVGETCQSGACTGGGDRDCSTVIPDPQCEAGTPLCDEALDACVAEPINEGNPCDDDQWCTLDDTCQSGVCTGDVRDCATDVTITEPQCQQASCGFVLEECFVETINEGATCDDGDACTHSDTCVDGACVGEIYTCGYFGSVCGTFTDGCGQTVQCEGPCPDGQVCFNYNCCTPSCSGKECGTDGCGGSCGSCTGNDVCKSDGSCCTPLTCSYYANQCGTFNDGCGGSIDCDGSCPGSQICHNNECCTPRTCDYYYGDYCNDDLSDGCGGTIYCSSSNCPSSQVCYGNDCCTPRTCDYYGNYCSSSANDGCGGTIDCSDHCGTGDICYGGMCCTPYTCEYWVDSYDYCASDAQDYCGAYIDCSDACPSGEVCWDDYCCTENQCGGCGYISTLTPVGTSCDSDDGDYCENGTYQCTADKTTVECVETESYTEICQNGYDDDCDGLIDENCDVVYDVSTGLYWEHGFECSTTIKVYSYAESYCDGLSAGGFNDWRIPTLAEVADLVECNAPYTNCSGCTSSDTCSAMFAGDTGSAAWTSTACASGHEYFSFANGNVTCYSSWPYYAGCVRCVRP